VGSLQPHPSALVERLDVQVLPEAEPERVVNFEKGTDDRKVSVSWTIAGRVMPKQCV